MTEMFMSENIPTSERSVDYYLRRELCIFRVSSSLEKFINPGLIQELCVLRLGTQSDRSKRESDALVHPNKISVPKAI